MQYRNALWAPCTSSLTLTGRACPLACGRVTPQLQEEGVIPAPFPGLPLPPALSEKGICLEPGA